VASVKGTGPDLAFLLNAAAWQDSLLQSYRTQLLSSQGLLFAFGAALLVAAFSIEPAVAVCGVSTLVLAIAIGGAWAYWRFRRVLESRSEDVDFWHERLIVCEEQLPLEEERVFTSFKCFQRSREILPDEHHPGQCSSRELARAGLGDTRGVITPVFASMLLCAWALLAAVAVAGMVAAVA